MYNGGYVPPHVPLTCLSRDHRLYALPLLAQCRRGESSILEAMMSRDLTWVSRAGGFASSPPAWIIGSVEVQPVSMTFQARLQSRLYVPSYFQRKSVAIQRPVLLNQHELTYSEDY